MACSQCRMGRYTDYSNTRMRRPAPHRDKRWPRFAPSRDRWQLSQPREMRWGAKTAAGLSRKSEKAICECS